MVVRRLSRCICLASIAILALHFVGCAATKTNNEGENAVTRLLTGSKEEATESPPPAGPTITVELRREGHSPQYARIPHQDGIHLQDALVQSGAQKKVNRMELYLLRKPPNGGPRQRLTADYDSGKKRVAWESDYALYPGDHVVVIEDNSSEFDHLVDRYLGGLGGRRK